MFNRSKAKVAFIWHTKYNENETLVNNECQDVSKTKVKLSY